MTGLTPMHQNPRPEREIFSHYSLSLREVFHTVHAILRLGHGYIYGIYLFSGLTYFIRQVLTHSSLNV